MSVSGLGFFRVVHCLIVTVNPKKLETGFRPNSAGIPYTLLLRIGAMGFPIFGLLLYIQDYKERLFLRSPAQTPGRI